MQVAAPGTLAAELKIVHGGPNLASMRAFRPLYAPHSQASRTITTASLSDRCSCCEERGCAIAELSPARMCLEVIFVLMVDVMLLLFK